LSRGSHEQDKNGKELMETMRQAAACAAVEQWLREEVVPGHTEYMADPSKGVPAEAVLDRIKARRAAGRP
jgi:hypothetical protein